MKNQKGGTTEEEYIIIEGRKKRISSSLYNILCILSFGMFYLLCKYLKKLRVVLLTKESKLCDANCVIVTNHYGNIEIVDIQEIELKITPIKLKRFLKDGKIRLIETQYMRFIYNPLAGRFVNPITIDKRLYSCSFEDVYENALNKDIKKERDKLVEDRIIYGSNETLLSGPTNSKIFLENLYSPIFLYVIFCSMLWMFIDYKFYACIILLLSLYSFIVDIIRDIKNAKVLNELTKKKKYVTVFRNRKWVSLETKELLPGDLIQIEVGKDFYCDARILKGDVIVDESFLTGETVPVAKMHSNNNNRVLAGTSILKSVINDEQFFVKFKDFKDQNLIDKNRNVICKVKNVKIRRKGEKIIETSKNELEVPNLENIEDKDQSENIANSQLAIGVVISIGYETSKGKLIRNILIPRPPNFVFYKESRKFLAWVFVVSLVMGIMLATYFFVRGVGVTLALVYAADLLTCILAPALPTTIKIGANISAKRLKDKGITCNDLERINSAGRTDIVIFDKTGTLTEEGLDILCIDNLENSMTDINLLSDITVKGLSSCHSLSELNGNYVGDPLDIKMFMFSGGKLESKQGIKSVIIGVNEEFRGPLFKTVDNSQQEEVCYCYENEENVLESGIESMEQVTEEEMNVFEKNEIIKDDHLGFTNELHKLQGNNRSTKNENCFLEEKEHESVKIINIYEFDSNLRRMSVFIKGEGYCRIYSKGSPESILSILKDIPEDYEETVKDYSLDGYRVVAMAYKECTDNSEISREEAEKDLIFLCFIVFANKLKPVTKSVLSELNESGIKTIMATGDNILTAISVGKQSNLIDKYVPIIFPVIDESTKSIYDVQWLCVGDEELIFDKITLKIYKGEDRISYSEFYVACEGREYEFFRNENEVYFSFILSKCAIFARMNPDQKKKIVEDFSNIGYSTCFCGDGANDCGALKSAEVGVSLAQTEASAASSFTSTVMDISSVVTILKEGRSALVTSVSRFKFVFLTSFIQFSSLTLLSLFFLFMSEAQTIHNDLMIVLPFAYVMTLFKPAEKLSRERPSARIITVSTFVSIFGNAIIQFTFLITILLICGTPKGGSAGFSTKSLGSTMVFSLTTFQNIAEGIIYTRGLPHREPKAKNGLFLVLVVLLVVSNMYILCIFFEPMNIFFRDYIISYYKFVMPESFRLYFGCLLLILLNFVFTFYFEYYLSKMLVNIFKFNRKLPLYVKRNMMFEEHI